MVALLLISVVSAHFRAEAEVNNASPEARLGCSGTQTVLLPDSCEMRTTMKLDAICQGLESPTKDYIAALAGLSSPSYRMVDGFFQRLRRADEEIISVYSLVQTPLVFANGQVRHAVMQIAYDRLSQTLVASTRLVTIRPTSTTIEGHVDDCRDALGDETTEFKDRLEQRHQHSNIFEKTVQYIAASFDFFCNPPQGPRAPNGMWLN